jgi:ABC-type uncharacterized transport system permease subunit
MELLSASMPSSTSTSSNCFEQERQEKHGKDAIRSWLILHLMLEHVGTTWRGIERQWKI